MSSKESSLLQGIYLQKSRLFLLPLTGLEKHKYFKSTNTYISSMDLNSDQYPDGISRYDEILIVTYDKDYKLRDDKLYDKINKNLIKITGDKDIPTGWEKFETECLFGNKSFVSFHETEEEYIYTFNLSDWHIDWSAFLKGRYSLFSEKAKDKIIKFRWESLHKVAQRKLYCYLYPDKEECVKAFAEELEIDVKDLMDVKELCDKPNFQQETFTCSLKQKPAHESQD
jgi:hypothetical protein